MCIQHVVRLKMLNSKQKMTLRKIAHSSEIVKCNVGKGNVDNTLLQSLENAINAHELIKVVFLKSALESKKMEELVLDISSGIKADVVQEIGHTVILYKANPKLNNCLKF